MRRFFQRIREKALDAASPSVLIAACGDSVTQGVMEYSTLAPEIVYHRLVQQRLEALFPTTTFNTINAGVSGSSAHQGLKRIERDVLSYRPDLVFIAFGLNDSLSGRPGLSDFQQALREMHRAIRETTSADIVFLTPPFMATRVTSRIHPEHEPFAKQIIEAQTSGILALYADAVRKIARQEKCAVADIHAEWRRLAECGVDTDLWLSNGLNHPDSRGHSLACEIILQTILPARNTMNEDTRHPA